MSDPPGPSTGDPSHRPSDRFLILGAIATALLLSLLGLLLTSWAQAYAANLFEAQVPLPDARDVVAARPRSLASIIPFALVGFAHGAAVLLSAKLGSVSRAVAVVGASTAGVLAAGLAFGEESPTAALVVLALSLLCAAAVGYTGSHLAFRMHKRHADKQV